MSKASQTIMQGILTEEQVFRHVMRKYGARGGKVNSERQKRARIQNLVIGREKLAALRAAGRVRK